VRKVKVTSTPQSSPQKPVYSAARVVQNASYLPRARGIIDQALSARENGKLNQALSLYEEGIGLMLAGLKGNIVTLLYSHTQTLMSPPNLP